MIRKSTSAHLIDNLENDYILETERLALLHQVESRIRSRSEAKKHIPSRPLEGEGNLEGQIAELLVAKDSTGKGRANIASKINNVRSLIEDASLPDPQGSREK